MENEQQENPQMAMKGGRQPYIKLLVMLVLSFISMYILMYAMVDSLKNVALLI